MNAYKCTSITPATQEHFAKLGGWDSYKDFCDYVGGSADGQWYEVTEGGDTQQVDTSKMRRRRIALCVIVHGRLFEAVTVLGYYYIDDPQYVYVPADTFMNAVT